MPAGRRGVARVLVPSDAGDLPTPCGKSIPSTSAKVQREPWKKRVCLALIANNPNNPASSRICNSGLMWNWGKSTASSATAAATCEFG